MYTSIRSCIQVDSGEITEMFQCNKEIRQGDGLRSRTFLHFHE